MAAGKHAVTDRRGLVPELGELDGRVLVRDGLRVAFHGAADGQQEIVSRHGHLAAEDDELRVEDIDQARQAAAEVGADLLDGLDGEGPRSISWSASGTWAG